MKIDIVSVFPEYFEVMNLSLMGKAQAKGLLEIKAHNLRDWTHDVHHSVMIRQSAAGRHGDEAEVWSECLDELLGFSQRPAPPPHPAHRCSSSRTHRPRCSPSATPPSSAMPTICCSAAAGMRLRCAHPGLLPRPRRRRTRIFDRRLCAERRRSSGIGDA